MLKKKKMKKAHKLEQKKRQFIYRPLKEDDRPARQDSDYHPEAYELFQSIRWDNAWKEFFELDKDGRFKYRTSWSFAKYIVAADEDKANREKAKWIYAAIGPMDKKSTRKKLVPYIGDWDFMRSNQFLGEMNKESLLFGNPKVQTIREMVTKQLDVMNVSQGVGELMVQWLGRYDAWSAQIDAYYQYKLFDPKLSDKDNEKRFHSYTHKQEYMFNSMVSAAKQIMKCFGVGDNDMALLTQMCIASMRDRLGEGTAKMMMAAASGMKIMDNQQMIDPIASVDQNTIEGCGMMLEKNPQLHAMFGTFLAKSKRLSMPHPDIEIEGVAEPIDPKAKTNGKTNGKHKSVN